MTVETAPMLPAVTQAGEDWEPRVTDKLNAYSPADFNLLLPTTQVRQVNPFLVPDIEVVQLNGAEEGGDIYHDSQMKQGHYAPNARGLAKLANVAGITQVDSRRMDDGKDPDVVEWRVEIEMTTPSGRTLRGFGSKRIDLHQFSETTNREGQKPSKARMDKSREHLVANAETKAYNRAIRSLLSLHGSYPRSQLVKPFAVLRYVPDMSQPEVRQAFLGQLVPAADRLYGPANGEQPKQLAGGGEVETAPEAPEEDPAPARDDVDADGVKIEEPDWGTSSEPAADAASDEPPEPRILISLRERADASEAKGEPTADQRAQLKTATAGIGIEAVQRVLIALWNLKAPGDITAAQAHAILDDAETRGKTFVAEWRAAAVWLKEGEQS
jgi:hypothetical protein